MVCSTQPNDHIPDLGARHILTFQLSLLLWLVVSPTLIFQTVAALNGQISTQPRVTADDAARCLMKSIIPRQGRQHALEQTLLQHHHICKSDPT